jgi:CRISPR-associated protein Csy2
MTFLMIPYLRAQSANIHNASFLLGGPPVLAAYFFAHALGRKLNFRAPRVALVHHSMQPKGQIGGYGVFYPQQRRAASFTYGANVGRDYSSKNKNALSLQPVATADMCMTLIVECDGLRSLQGVADFLFGARFSGGAIVSTGGPKTFPSFEDAIEAIPSGFAVMDRRDLLERRDSKNQAELLIETLGASPSKAEGTSWLSAASLGYAAISTFERRVGAREGYEHAFAEPLVGVVQYRSIRECQGLKPEELLWQSEWIKEDVFRVVQKKIYQMNGG